VLCIVIQLSTHPSGTFLYIKSILSWVLQVVADGGLADVLIRQPLLATLMAQGPTRSRTATPGAIPLGTAEIDMSPLLQPRCGVNPFGVASSWFWVVILCTDLVKALFWTRV
jgi:hypothetical protein